MTGLPGTTTSALLDRFESDGLDGVVCLLRQKWADGATLRTVIETEVAPALTEVGTRWESGRWTIAQEHAVTAVIEAAILAVERDFLPAPTAGPLLVVACTERERHTLPGRLATLALRSDGHNAVFVGPALTPDVMCRQIARVGPKAVGLSVTVATALLGARALVRAAHSVGVPVMIGGGAIRSTPWRGLAVGADSVEGYDDVARFLAAPTVSAPRVVAPSPSVVHEASDLCVAAERTAAAAAAVFRLQSAHHRPTGHRDRHVRAHLEAVVYSCAAAVDVGDASILGDTVQALGGCEPGEDFIHALICLRAALGRQFPTASRIIGDEIERYGGARLG